MSGKRHLFYKLINSYFELSRYQNNYYVKFNTNHNCKELNGDNFAPLDMRGCICHFLPFHIQGDYLYIF